jgi:dihydrofolate synthase/folylpolyglutamate synthase
LSAHIPNGYNPRVEKTRYQQALDYLYSFIDYSVQRTYQYSDRTFDLGRVHAFLALLGDPHRKYAVLHVAGTKGKGSVSAMLDSILRTAGFRTGFYTSPHLIDFCERIRFGGAPISGDRLADLVDEVRPQVEKIPGLTTFEITTGLAFLYFAQERADAVVAEVGLGGRLDATNVVTPLLSIITSLSFDHTHLLGNTLAEIAREKAGIVKPGIPVVSAPQEGEALKVLIEIARERGCPLTLVGRDWRFATHTRSLDRQSFSIWSDRDQNLVDKMLEKGEDLTYVPMRYTVPLLGYHQVINAATAYAAIRAAGECGLTVPEDAIRAGFLSVRWDGRFQILNRSPLVVVDSAHNRDSARRLRTALDDYFPTRRAILLFGVSEDKDIGGILDELLPRISRVVATRSTHPRAAAPDTILALVRARGCAAEGREDPADALALALSLTGEGDVLLAAGSLFVAGAVLSEWPRVWRRVEQSRRRMPAEDRASQTTDVENEWTRIS